MAKWIRLKPLDGKKGHVIRRFTAFSLTFEEARGWYRATDDMAAYLATVHQVPNDEDTPLAFDVCTRAEAEQIEAAEKRKAEERARAAEPHVAEPRDVVGFADARGAEPAQSGRRARPAASGRRA